MLKLRRRLDLGQKPLGAKRSGEIGMQDLDRNVAIMLEIVSEIYRGHAADPDLAGDSISALESSRKSWQDVAHMTPSYGITVHPETKIFFGSGWHGRCGIRSLSNLLYDSLLLQVFHIRRGRRRSCMLES